MVDIEPPYRDPAGLLRNDICPYRVLPYPTLTSHPRLTRQLSPSQWWRSRVRIYLHKLGHLSEIFEHQSNHATAMFSALFLSLTDNRIQHFELLIKQYNILFLFFFPRSLIVVNYQNRQKSFPYEVQTPHQVVIISFTTRTHTCC